MPVKTVTLKRAKQLRREMTPPEVILWERLRAGRLNGLKFRRQHPVGRYILDFYCPSARLAIEVDGAHHFEAEAIAQDERRTTWLGQQGIRVLRIPASAITDAERRDAFLRQVTQALIHP